ncbi:MAG: hypothetical protein DHS20C17_34890 [Cyclobacteriaceae bacterium]|nr:MAG: hypothetical protein DHS20C17_34890 [Cyclobacteriaceae bacterium]
MKPIYLYLSFVLLITSCSSIKVLDAWRGDNINSIKTENILVIARADNELARVSFEKEIADQIRAKDLKATESHKQFPGHNPDKKLSDEEIAALKTKIQQAGFNGVVVSVLKDLQTTTRVTEDGGYYTGGYTGGPYGSYYPGYYGGFYGYYGNAMSYATYGNYVPTTINTSTSKTYILETVVYNLDQPDDKQLIAVVTSKVDNPQSVTTTAKQYAQAIAKALQDK